VLHQAGAVKGAAVCEELVQEVCFADEAALKLYPGGGVLGGQQLLEGQVEVGGHVVVKGVIHNGVLHVVATAGGGGAGGDNGEGVSVCVCGRKGRGG
jgi:hypothetical protein